MRRFTSYGPVDPELHYAVPRTALIEECVGQLVGHPEKGGHFFTIWGPRQTGKTWIMRRAMEEIRARHGDRFQVETLSMQGISARSADPDAAFLRQIPVAFRRGMNLKIPPLADFSEWGELFGRDRGLFERPLILLIDEFDRLRPSVIDELVAPCSRSRASPPRPSCRPSASRPPATPGAAASPKPSRSSCRARTKRSSPRSPPRTPSPSTARTSG
jgi:hypothetical protein